jgi:hypothetical protein
MAIALNRSSCRRIDFPSPAAQYHHQTVVFSKFFNWVSKAVAGTLAALKEWSVGALDWYPGTALRVEYHCLPTVFGSR